MPRLRQSVTAIDGCSYDGAEILQNDSLSSSQNGCKHAVESTDHKGEPIRVIPWSISVYTECGHVSGSECLECALETARDVGFVEKSLD